jgi:hypothetical protein
MKPVFFGAVGLLVVLFCQACERPDVRFPRFTRDRLITWGILEGIEDLYAQNVSGLPAGAVDVTAACPDGGSVHITGTLQSDGNSSDLAYDLDGCAFEVASTDGTTIVSLTLTGRIDQDISIDVAGYGSVELTSESLEMKGWEYNNPEEADVDLTCPFSVTQAVSSISGAIMGKLCGRDTTWTYYHESCTG